MPNVRRGIRLGTAARSSRLQLTKGLTKVILNIIALWTGFSLFVTIGIIVGLNCILFLTRYSWWIRWKYFLKIIQRNEEALYQYSLHHGCVGELLPHLLASKTESITGLRWPSSSFHYSVKLVCHRFFIFPSSHVNSEYSSVPCHKS